MIVLHIVFRTFFCHRFYLFYLYRLFSSTMLLLTYVSHSLALKCVCCFKKCYQNVAPLFTCINFYILPLSSFCPSVLRHCFILWRKKIFLISFSSFDTLIVLEEKFHESFMRLAVCTRIHKNTHANEYPLKSVSHQYTR